MIRNGRDVALVALGILVAVCIVSSQNLWTIVPLSILIPWDKVFAWFWLGLEELYEWHQDALKEQEVKNLRNEIISGVKHHETRESVSR